MSCLSNIVFLCYFLFTKLGAEACVIESCVSLSVQFVTLNPCLWLLITMIKNSDSDHFLNGGVLSKPSKDPPA